MYTPNFFIYLFDKVHLGCLYLLEIVHNVAIIFGIKVFGLLLKVKNLRKMETAIEFEEPGLWWEIVKNLRKIYDF